MPPDQAECTFAGGKIEAPQRGAANTYAGARQHPWMRGSAAVAHSLPPTPDDLADYLDNFARRVLQDALNEATRSYWLRRAETFDAVGTPTADATARACRARADLAPLEDLDAALWNALRDAS